MMPRTTIQCSYCGTKNRVKSENLTLVSVRCRECGKLLDVGNLRSTTQGREQSGTRKTVPPLEEKNYTFHALLLGMAAVGVLVLAVVVILRTPWEGIAEPASVAASDPTIDAAPAESSDQGEPSSPSDRASADHQSRDVAESLLSENTVAQQLKPADQSAPSVTVGIQADLSPEKSETLPGPTGRFQFADEDQFQYQYTLTAKVGARVEEITGLAVLQVTSREAQAEVIERGEESFGTAFGVTSTGYLVTCAHVIEDAYEIDVLYGNQSFPARVVTINQEQDLALLKINVRNLPTIPLLTEKQPALGEDVRAVGYPLADLLGQGVKVTRGTVSGYVNLDTGVLMQVDAAINSGNSGGPIVDSCGQVIGVASAKLHEYEASNVAFCVPANYVTELLQQANVSPTARSANRTELSGPELVAKVAPAVGFVKVKSGPDPRLQYTAFQYLSTNSRSRQAESQWNLPRLRIGINPNETVSDHLLVSQTGRLVDAPQDNQLPFLFGSAVNQVLFEFPAAGEQIRLIDRETGILSIEGANFLPGTDRVKYLYHPAREKTQYKIRSEDETELVMEKAYEIKTLNSEAGPHFSMTAQGSQWFDKQRGLTVKFSCLGKFRYQTSGSPAEVQMLLTGSLIPADQMRRLALRKPSSFRSPPPQASLPAKTPAIARPELIKQQISGIIWSISCTSLSPIDRFVAIGKIDQLIEIYDRKTGDKLHSTERLDDIGNILCVVFHSRQSQLLAGGYKGKIQIFDVAETGALTRNGEYNGHSKPVQQIVISPAGKSVLSSSQDKKVRMWNLATRREGFVTPEFKGNTLAMYFIDESRAWFCDGLVLQQWNLESGQMEQSHELQRSSFSNAIQFSPDGGEVAVAAGYELKRWRTQDGTVLPVMKGEEIAWNAIYTKDGKHLITGGPGHLTFWDVATGKNLSVVPLGNSRQPVKSMAISDDGSELACAPQSASESLWIVDLKWLSDKQ